MRTRRNKVFDVDAFLESEAGEKHIDSGLKTKTISFKEFLKRTSNTFIDVLDS